MLWVDVHATSLQWYNIVCELGLGLFKVCCMCAGVLYVCGCVVCVRVCLCVCDVSESVCVHSLSA